MIYKDRESFIRIFFIIRLHLPAAQCPLPLVPCVPQQWTVLARPNQHRDIIVHIDILPSETVSPRPPTLWNPRDQVQTTGLLVFDLGDRVKMITFGTRDRQFQRESEHTCLERHGSFGPSNPVYIV